jgi:hypothetical protein
MIILLDTTIHYVVPGVINSNYHGYCRLQRRFLHIYLQHEQWGKGSDHIGHKSHVYLHTSHQNSSQEHPADGMSAGINKITPTSTCSAFSLNPVKVEVFFVEIDIHHAGSFPFEL